MLYCFGNNLIANLIRKEYVLMANITIIEALDRISEATRNYIDNVIQSQGGVGGSTMEFAKDEEVDDILKEVLKTPK